jgi:hypothetical protein
MTSGRLKYELIMRAALAIVTVSFFRSSFGAYSVVHGPATVFQGARAAARAYESIVQATLAFVRIKVVSRLFIRARLAVVNARSHQLGIREHLSAPRC